MRRLFKPFIFALAVLLIAEEWLWDGLKAVLKRFSGLPAVAQLEADVRRLPPWASLLVLAVPALIVLPFKIAGLWALANEHAVAGVVIFVTAKLVGTAAAAYLFDLVRDSVRQLRWFDVIYVFAIALIARAKDWLRSLPMVQSLRAAASARRHRLSLQWAVFRSKLLGDHDPARAGSVRLTHLSRLSRRLRAAKIVARRASTNPDSR